MNFAEAGSLLKPQDVLYPARLSLLVWTDLEPTIGGLYKNLSEVICHNGVLWMSKGRILCWTGLSEAHEVLSLFEGLTYLKRLWPKLYINGENVLFDLGNRHSMKDYNLRIKCANSTIDFKFWPRLVTLVSWLSCNKGTTDFLWYPSPTFSAFFRVHDTMKDRIPATVWLFESGDFHVLCDADITFSDESVPAGDGLLLHFKVSVDFLISQAFDTFRWRFFGGAVSFTQPSFYRLWLLRFFCQDLI